MPSSVIQEGGKRRKSKASRKSKKSMRGGAILNVVAPVVTQEGGKRRKSKASRKSKKSMRGGAILNVAATSAVGQAGGKYRKSKASRKSKKPMRGGAAGASAAAPECKFNINEETGMMQYFCGGFVTMVLLKGMIAPEDQKLHGMHTIGRRADGTNVFQVITIAAISATKCQIQIEQKCQHANGPTASEFTNMIELPIEYFSQIQDYVHRSKSGVESILSAVATSLAATDPKRNHALKF